MQLQFNRINLKSEDEIKTTFFLKGMFLVFLCFSLLTINAQEAIPATGGNATGSGGTVSYSAGQVVFTTNTGTNGSVAQGVQQPFEISIVTGLENTLGISLYCMVYPNPTTDFLTLKIDNYGNRKLSYKLFDVNGKLLEIKKINSNETIIVMTNFVPAIYFLNVIDNDKQVKTFKIIKR